MVNDLKLIPPSLFASYKEAIKIDLTNILLPEGSVLPNVKPFDFYNSISSVYSSKIEGEDIVLDSYIKHKFCNVAYQPDYTKKTDDLFNAYQFAQEHPLTFSNAMQAHELLSQNLLAPSARGRLRNNLMFVMDDKDNIIYVACEPTRVDVETKKIFHDINILLKKDLSTEETFYYAAFIHLMLVKVHPMQDGNGRLSRLIEKWFLTSKLGKEFWKIKSEKYYYTHIINYYHHLAITGLEYEDLKIEKSILFLSLLPQSISFE